MTDLIDGTNTPSKNMHRRLAPIGASLCLLASACAAPLPFRQPSPAPSATPTVARPGQAVILLADARHRVEGLPGLTDF
jgi:hypothetical protein